MSFFSRDKKSGINKRRSASSQDAVTILTAGCHFAGKLYCKGSSRIAGKIEGEIISEGLLIVEEDAVIHANVKAEEAIIQGKFKGSLTASSRAELSKTANFEGELTTPNLMITEGAQFNGRASMRSSEKKLEEVLPVVEELYRKKSNHSAKDISPLSEVSLTK